MFFNVCLQVGVLQVMRQEKTKNYYLSALTVVIVPEL